MARLFVITARDEHAAIIIRRMRSGSSRWYQLIQWDTRRDNFSDGAWLNGRIYEDKCDLSPDGRLFIYSVLKYHGHVQPNFPHAWTAVSRPPWLHALVLWPQSSTYGGGGQFTAPRTLWGVSDKGTHPDFPFRGLQLAESPPPPRATESIVPEADWSGFDHAGNIIFCVGDTLFRRKKLDDKLVADFSGRIPNPQPAPDWATRPL